MPVARARTFAGLLGVLLLTAPACRSNAQPRPPELLTPPEYDWCAKIVVRPDARVRTDCTPLWPAEEIAAGAEVVLLGSGYDVADPVLPARPDACGRVYTHDHNARYIDRLRRLAAAKPGLETEYIHMHRFELVSRSLAALPGFDPAFLLTTRRSYDRVASFFDDDRSVDCRLGGCRWSDATGGRDDADAGGRLRDLIDAHGPPGRHRSVVYYLGHGREGRTFWPVAAVADLTNPGYRAWRVAEARRAFARGGYTAIMLNQKFHQYAQPEAWIASASTPNVTALNREEQAAFTAPFERYGFGQYVAGWARLAKELSAAGVPYAVSLPGHRATARADDPATPGVHEGQRILDAARHARVVLLDTSLPAEAATAPEAVADLSQLGARVIPFKLSCGYKR